MMDLELGGENEVQLKIEQTPRHYHFFNINDINNHGNVTAELALLLEKQILLFYIQKQEVILINSQHGKN